ncbi:NAD-dependent protein deacetylase sirtuin-2 isoform X3 [Heterocephalus glaber]|uniref:NAD-dependent protein deacetylase sirtuin-2 n=1 Tax=Heterocephalus glaber TaxID=10181 RepID=A0AAX6R1J6_HETGA|nr:NAD-dependent protein deacetylase sirtuin-2 isoform X3 [Heterocephalus glaber]
MEQIAHVSPAYHVMTNQNIQLGYCSIVVPAFSGRPLATWLPTPGPLVLVVWPSRFCLKEGARWQHVKVFNVAPLVAGSCSSLPYSCPFSFRCRHGTEQSVTAPRPPPRAHGRTGPSCASPKPITSTALLSQACLPAEPLTLWRPRQGRCRRLSPLRSILKMRSTRAHTVKDTDLDAEEGASGGEAEMDFLRSLFSQTLGLGSQKERLLDELTLEGVVRYMQSERCQRVICLVGAGISTSAGIPDFRSPTTGLYANLEKYHLPYPEAIFEIGYFKKHPEPFFALAKELYPGQFKPTICHYFIRLLKEKGLLLRCYTQNIDTLERVAGLEPEDLVEAHGTFYTSHCTSQLCRHEYTLGWMKEKLFSEVTPKCEKCQSVVKPDIIFFGENLPSRFFSCLQSDFRKVDLLIIMGTSLQVQPFASLIGKAPLSTPRLLINKEKTGQTDPFLGMMMGLGGGMDFDSKKAYRDVAWLGDCDQGCLALADLLGWKKELEDLVRKEHAHIDAQSGSSTPNPTTAASPRTSPPPGKAEAKTTDGEKPQ